MNKYVFCGAHSTGKTTILNQFKDSGKEIITEVVRNLAKNGVKINREGDEKGQKKIFAEYLKLFKEKSNFVSDRGLIDVVAYTVYLSRIGKVSEKFADKQLKDLHKFVINNPDIVYFFFPIEFDIVEDGVRDNDEQFRKDIEEIIVSILASLGLKFVVVSGTVEERMNKIKRVENWFEEYEQLFTIINIKE